MIDDIRNIPILPFSYIVGQKQLKLALKLAYIAPKIGGVLVSGHRGTGKSTAVRAFGRMMNDDGKLPVTLPINATEDRVVGGWRIDELMKQVASWRDGLLVEANKGMLFIDEVNLLDDHIVNIILDTTATGILTIQRDDRSDEKAVSFGLVGTMNPEEGGLRPQLLDRFGLLVSVHTENDPEIRSDILNMVIQFDQACRMEKPDLESKFYRDGLEQDKEMKTVLNDARDNLDEVDLPKDIIKKCIELARSEWFHAEGHRADYVMALAARANAALHGKEIVSVEHLESVVPLAIQHRREKFLQTSALDWSNDDRREMEKILNDD